MNLASVDGSEDGYIGGSQTQMPDYNRSTIGVDEDEGLWMTQHSVSTKGRRSIMNKYRRDNQTYCGTASGSGKCSIF